MKKIIKAIGLCLGVIVLAAAVFILYRFVTDYRPQDEEEVVLEGSGSRAIAPGDALSVLTFNIGYGGLDADTDFFMDGGSAVLATSKEKVESNISGVEASGPEKIRMSYSCRKWIWIRSVPGM